MVSPIENAIEYAVVVKERNSKIHIEYVAQAESLDARWFNVCMVPGTQQLRCIVPHRHGRDKLLVAETSDADSFTVVSIRKAETGSSDEDDDEKHEEGEEGEGTQEDNSTDYGKDDGEVMIDITFCITVAAQYQAMGCGYTSQLGSRETKPLSCPILWSIGTQLPAQRMCRTIKSMNFKSTVI